MFFSFDFCLFIYFFHILIPNFQIMEYPKWRENKNKFNPGVEEIDKHDRHDKTTYSTNITLVVKISTLPEYGFWRQVSKQMHVGYASPLPHLDKSIHCHAWVYITCWEIPAKNCQWKKFSFYPIINLYFKQEPITLQHGPVKILNLLLLTFFQHC